MSEMREAAQELLDFYDSLKAKYGRVAEYKNVGKKMERLRKAVAKGDSLELQAAMKAGLKQAEELGQAKKTIAEIDEVFGGGADEELWPPGKTRAEAIAQLIKRLDDYQRQHDLRQKYEAQVRELNERQKRLEAENEKLKSSYEACDHERGVVHKDLGNTKKTILYLQVLLPQLKEKGDVATAEWVEAAFDEGEQPHTSPEAEERLAKIKELVEASNEVTDDL